MDHVILEGKRIWAGTDCEQTWIIYHDHLKIWWEKNSQDYLRSLPCPIQGNPSQTWYDWQIKICGEANNAKASKGIKVVFRRQPQVNASWLSLICWHARGGCKNVALTYHINEGHEDWAKKYSFATPAKVYDALQRMIATGCPSPLLKCIFEETLGRIVEAQGGYIEDSSGRIAWSGIHAEAAAEYKRETIPVDASALLDQLPQDGWENDKWWGRELCVWW
jgi:hypothetical protein